MQKNKRLVITHKPTGRKAVINPYTKQTNLALLLQHICNRNHWALGSLKLKHITNSNTN